jgi:hypothetical protein
MEDIGQFQIPYTSTEEIVDIACYLNKETGRIDRLKMTIRESINKLGELRIALISAAVTGKIDVREEVVS